MTDIQISSPKDSDWEWIKEKHAEAAWLSLPPGLQSAVTLQTVRANLTGQTAELLREHGKSNQVFTARLPDGELAGYIWVGEIKSGFTGTAHAYIFSIHVAEEFRERGIGTRLVACAEDWAHTHQYQRIGLAVSSSNAAALHLYEKTGYAVETLRMFKETGVATGIGLHRVTDPGCSANWKQPHPKTHPGVGLEGCPYLKNNQQKTARIMQPPDRFLFLLLFLIFLWLTP